MNEQQHKADGTKKNNGVWLYLSDMDLGGSGYMHIGTRLVNQLVLSHHIGMIVLGFMYDRRPHPWPFSIIPIRSWQQVKTTIELIQHSGIKIAGIIQAMDIPLQAMLMREITTPIPRISIFPVETAPLSMEWASNMAMASRRFVMSQTAKDALGAYGIDSEVLPIGVFDREAWRPPTPDEKAEARKVLGMDDNVFSVLTIGDNQERKNLAGMGEAIARFALENRVYDESTGHVSSYDQKYPVHWHCVTRVDSQVGWQLDDLALRLGIYDIVTWHRRGMPHSELKLLMDAADCFFIGSKGEGLGVPVLEAMWNRTPVVATNFSALAEHLAGGERGYPVDIEYAHTDVWGNGTRVFIDPTSAANQLLDLYQNGPKPGMLDRAEEYIRGRDWVTCANMLAKVMKELGEYE